MVHIEDLPADIQRQIRGGDKKKSKRPGYRKYGEQKVYTESDGVFDSQWEYELWQALCDKHGGRKNIIRQVAFKLNKKYLYLDFQIILEKFEDGSIRTIYVDAKGQITREWSAKVNHLEDIYNIKIFIVRRIDPIP